MATQSSLALHCVGLVDWCVRQGNLGRQPCWSEMTNGHREITKDLPTKKHKPRVSHQFTSVRRERETENMAKKMLQLPTSLEICFASSSEDRASEPEVFDSSEEEEYKDNNKDPFGHG